MSLISSLQLGNNALRAANIGLQVVGQNIANVNTPGYVREEVVLIPAPTQRIGKLVLGLGVEVQGVIQRIDRFLEERLRGAGSDRASTESQEQVYLQLEGLIGELSDTDLSTSLNEFFNSISEVLNQPESASVRNLAVLKGSNLTADIARLANRTVELRGVQNQQVVNAAADINRLVSEIRKLNVQIAATEGGRIQGSEAVGLRDQRGNALSELAQLVDTRVDEQPSGAVNVFVGGDYLVFGGESREVRLQHASEGGQNVSTIVLSATDAPLEISSGRVAGLYLARDEILGGFRKQLDDFAGTLAFEFNKVFSSGQGLRGYREIVSERGVDSAAAPLDAAGLPFTPVNGSFKVQVLDRQTGLTETTDIFVPLAGLETDITLEGLRAALDAVDGIAATITTSGQLQLRSESATQEFAFAADTSGVLAALGVATFFSGNTASGLGVRKAIVDDPARFAASQGGIGKDTANAVELARFLDRPVDSADGATLGVLYDRLVIETTQASNAAGAVAEGFRVFEQTLLGDHLAITGVSLDEEVVRLIMYQRAFQATARFISTINELLGVLVNL